MLLMVSLLSMSISNVLPAIGTLTTICILARALSAVGARKVMGVCGTRSW